MLTDVILQAGPEQFHAHKLVLASASPYFKVSHLLSVQIYIFLHALISVYSYKNFSFAISLQAMFTGGLKECDMSLVKLQGVCPTTLARILHFMYTGVIRVTEVTVCQLLPAATMFQVNLTIVNLR